MTSRLLNFAKKFKSLYTGRYALVTNTMTAGTIGCGADTLAQFLETVREEKEWDVTRSKNMTLIAFGFGPIVHYWFRFLDNTFPGTKGKSVAKKVSLDCAIAPVFYFGYLGVLCFLKGYSWNEFVVEFKNKAPLLLGTDLVFWPFLQSFNFLFIPPHYRIIGLKFNELLVGVVMSHVVNNAYSFKGLVEWAKGR
uniref:Mitochondrial inner membrane protein Mpv17 n=1 Tax=Phallusia mammillata TaxID=59560 RepID=A0A6F9DKH3_9ASCI|nr:mpv17-like protein 2 [Phallusia mammillata]